jgi:hypothetical protein
VAHNSCSKYRFLPMARGRNIVRPRIIPQHKDVEDLRFFIACSEMARGREHFDSSRAERVGLVAHYSDGRGL